VENIYVQTYTNTNLSVEELKERIKEVWPMLEAVAKSVDVVNL
jgi:SET and MYND domain-containing protein